MQTLKVTETDRLARIRYGRHSKRGEFNIRFIGIVIMCSPCLHIIGVHIRGFDIVDETAERLEVFLAVLGHFLDDGEHPVVPRLFRQSLEAEIAEDFGRFPIFHKHVLTIITIIKVIKVEQS